MFKGSITALITPFKDGALDETAFRRFVQWQIKQGTHGLVPCGTTGESPALSHEEHIRLVELCVRTAAGKVPVLAGTGSNSTAEAVHLTRAAARAGADAALVVTPYYNKPSQEGLIAHYRKLAEAVPGLPIIIYNIPGRSVIDMSVETMARLAEIKTIAGVKDATGDVTRVSRQRAACGADFCQLSGEDASALGFMAHGGQGCISVTANAAPALCAEFQNACLAGDFRKALALQDKLMPLHQALFAAPSPAPAKCAVELLGFARAETRLPLLPAGTGVQARLREALASLALLPA